MDEIEFFEDDEQRYQVEIKVTSLNSDFPSPPEMWIFVINTERATNAWTSKVSAKIEQELDEYFYDKRLH